MPRPVKRRSYDSPRRRAQAAATRAAILEAAHELFVEGGYAGTTIEMVAERAGVSAETIYAAFTNKRTILARVVDVAIAGDAPPVPVLERPWVRHLAAEPDPRRRIALLARNGRLLLERWTPVYDVVTAAADADPEIAELWEDLKAQRLEGQRALLRVVAERAPLRPGLSPREAADVLFAVGSPETYRLLVGDRGWSADRFERWYAGALERLVFDATAAKSQPVQRTAAARRPPAQS
jgi:AcrR family transcriptional regulator